MSERKELLGVILITSQQLHTFKNVELSKKEIELVSKIREELTKLAGPEDIMSVKIIKKNMLDKARRYMLELIKHGYSQNVSMGVIQETFYLPIDVILDLWNECMKLK